MPQGVLNPLFSRVGVPVCVHSVHREGKNGNKNQKIIIKRGKARLFDLEKVANKKYRCTNRCQYTYISIHFLVLV